MSFTETIRQVAEKIPGYEGYASRERRRDADRALREATAAAFDSQVSRVSRLQEQLMDSGDFDRIEALDGVIGRLQHLADRIRHASYGYAGLFDRETIEEAALDMLYALDLALANGVEKMGDHIAGLGLKDDFDGRLERLRDHLDRLHDAVDRRRRLLEQGSPDVERPAADTHPDQ